MANHRAQEQFNRAKWRFWVLAPFWALQLTLAMAMIGLFSWRLADTISHYDERDKAGKKPVIEFVWEATNIGMSSIAAICTFVELAKYFTETLTPWTMLFTHVIKLTCASAILVLDVVVYVERSESYYTVIGLALDAALMITAIALAVYAIRAYRRLSKYDDYAYPVNVNVKSYGHNDGFEYNSSYSSRNSMRSTGEKRVSFGSARLSMGSVISEPISLQSLEQPPKPYDHQRDTQFDAYLTRRKSDAKADVEKGLGRSSPPGEWRVDGSTRSRGSSVSRVVSLTSEQVLRSVPEEEGDVVEADHPSTDQETLLEHKRKDSEDGTNESQAPQEVEAPQEVDAVEPKWQQK